MQTISLKDNWTLTVLEKNIYNIPEEPIATTAPSTVYSTLLEKNMIPDPYFRDNELDALKLMENDFAYNLFFAVYLGSLLVMSKFRSTYFSSLRILRCRILTAF